LKNDYDDVVEEENLYDVLPTDIKELLKSKPDIEKIHEESIQFCKNWEYTIALNDELVKSYDKVVHHAKRQMNQIKSQIFEHSILDSDVKN